MTAGPRWLVAIVVILACCTAPSVAQDTAPAPSCSQTPAPVGSDAARLLELGKLLMGQNNPTYATSAASLDAATRNAAGEQALRLFRRVVKIAPKYAEGWLWLGIGLTETLQYTKAHPKGITVLTPERIAEGLDAFRKACEYAPVDLICVSYYTEALMVYRRDFDTARRLWDIFARAATTDMQRVTAYTQAARACFNKAYFGKSDKMAADEVKAHFQAAEEYLAQAVNLCPNSALVKEMQALLQQHRKSLLGKD